MTARSLTRDQNQIDHFTKDSANWWDPDGPFKPLHALNPVRLNYIRGRILSHFQVADSIGALAGLSVLDIGCGGGIVCEPVRRMGADVTGIDADARAIETARAHAREENLSIDYICAASEDMVAQERQYDIVLALEIIEHVSHPSDFVSHCAQLTRPGGIVIFSTLNRTFKSYALGIIGAEYILRWVPAGTHDWKRFLKPSELARLARASGLRVQDVTGLVFNPFKNDFALHPSDLDVNYFLVAEKN